MRRLLPLICAPALLAGCEQAEPSASRDDKHVVRMTTVAVPSAAAAPAIAAGPREVSEQNDLYSFDYAYPAQAGAIPALKAWFDAQIENERAKLVAEAKKGRAEAKQGGYSFNPYYRATGWQVVTDLPGWLSLSAAIETYAGGAHPNHWPGALLWDKAAAKRRLPLDLFATKRALSQAIRGQFCAEIDRQREERRGEKVDRSSGDMFNDCIDPVEQTVILGSSNRRTFDRIGVLVAPYEAGPYAEGDYEVTLPVTQAVLAAVKPEFRPAFSLNR